MNLVNKKLNKINDDEYESIKKFIIDGKNIDFNELSEDSKKVNSSYTFREILESEQTKNIWLQINADYQIEQLFEKLTLVQKSIHTILPTKNNMDSSRGHTCVLVKIIEKSDEGTSSDTKYFPLFDMAGTENPEKMKDFFTGDNRNKTQMNKLIKIISGTQS